jgi:short subunit dehydrogenase-like uncharacterized protein
VAPTWLLYGAYGYTGRLIAREALRRGHRPILAGRDGERLRRLALALAAEVEGSEPEVRVFPLDDPETLVRGLDGVSAVFHAAGPFVHTAPPMLDGALRAGAHYLDISGEVPSFEHAFGLDHRARERGVILMPGVGMDVIPTDAVAAALAEALPGAVRLELALHSPGRASAGTLRTVVEHVPGGLLVRREGRLMGVRPSGARFRREVDMGPPPGEGPMVGVLGGRRPVAPYTWADLSTAYRTTGIPDITCYAVTPRTTVRLMPVVLPVLRLLLSMRPVRALARWWVGRGGEGPSAEARRTGRVRAWGRVEDGEGRAWEAVLELPESYRFTAEAGVRALEETIQRGESGHSGTLTPAGALGVDWVLGLPGVHWVRPPEPVG